MQTLHDITAALIAPFPSDLIDLKPGALTPDRTRALALAYADARVYQERLDQTVGPDHWSVRFDLMPAGAICTLTICGVAKADVGDFPLDLGEKPNENRSTTAAAQAFKRACAQFGIGRYLYALPRTWSAYDSHTRQFAHPATIVVALYEAAGLGDYISDATTRALRTPRSTDGQPPAAAPAEAASAAPGDPPTDKLARARAALASIEHRAPVRANGDAPTATNRRASEKQIRYLIRLLKSVNVSADELDALAHQVDVDIAVLARPERLEASGLPAKAASTLIEELIALGHIHNA